MLILLHLLLVSADSDYTTLMNYPFQFSPDVYTDCVNITILEDEIVEPDQSFTVSLSSNDPVSFTDSIQSASVIITANDGKKGIFLLFSFYSIDGHF